MDPSNFIDPNLTEPDLLVLKNLLDDAEHAKPEEKNSALRTRNRSKKRMSWSSAMYPEIYLKGLRVLVLT